MARLVQLGGYENEGERLLAETLRDSLGEDYLVISSVPIVEGRWERQVDLIVLGPSAAFVLESKYWEGEVEGSYTGNWIQKRPDGTTEHPENPLHQVDRHWKALSFFVRSKFPQFSTWIEPLVVFTHPRTQANWEVSGLGLQRVMTMSQATDYIATFSPEVRWARELTADNRQAILSVLEAPGSQAELGTLGRRINRVSRCPRCRGVIRTLGQSCEHCGADIGGAPEQARPHAPRASAQQRGVAAQREGWGWVTPAVRLALTTLLFVWWPLVWLNPSLVGVLLGLLFVAATLFAWRRRRT